MALPLIAFLILSLSLVIGDQAPKRWHQWIPFLFLCAGLWIGHNLQPHTVDVFMGYMICYFFACLMFWGNEVRMNIYTRYLYPVDDVKPTPRLIEHEEPRHIPNLAPFQQVTAIVRFDMERQMAKDLLIMHDFKPNDEAVTLKEDYWKRPNKFGSRDAFVLVREKWERRKIVAKKSARKNATYGVINWEAVRLIADGNPVPEM